MYCWKEITSKLKNWYHFGRALYYIIILFIGANCFWKTCRRKRLSTPRGYVWNSRSREINAKTVWETGTQNTIPHPPLLYYLALFTRPMNGHSQGLCFSGERGAKYFSSIRCIENSEEIDFCLSFLWIEYFMTPRHGMNMKREGEKRKCKCKDIILLKIHRIHFYIIINDRLELSII